MYNFVVCSVFKNEAHVLEEWLDHYFYHGVEHIFLVNDFSTDNFMDIINYEKYKDKITLFNNDIITKNVGRQIMIYYKYFSDILKLSKWISILDLDEFLYCPNDINIQNVLKNYDDFNLIIVDCYYFGSNNQIEQPSSVVNGFTRREIKDVNNNKGHKYIVKSNYIIRFDIHHCQVYGPIKHLKLDNNHAADFIINHYVIQSYNFFMKIKATRGDINNYIESIGLARDDMYFKNNDKNDVYDDKLVIQNKCLIDKYINN